MHKKIDGAYLLPYCRLAAQLILGVLPFLRSVNLDHATVELGLVHVVSCLACVLWEREFNVAEAAMWVGVGCSGERLASCRHFPLRTTEE